MAKQGMKQPENRDDRAKNIHGLVPILQGKMKNGKEKARRLLTQWGIWDAATIIQEEIAPKQGALPYGVRPVFLPWLNDMIFVKSLLTKFDSMYIILVSDDK